SRSGSPACEGTGRRDRSVRREARRGRGQAERLQGLAPTADGAAGARGRGRPARPRCRRGALLVRVRSDRSHPLEGPLRGARGSRRRLRERSRRPRRNLRQEPLMNNVLLVVVVIVALGFDFTNGFHDTANAVATSISTRALSPRMAVAVASVANLVGAFVTTAVAKTVGKGIIDTGLANTRTVLAALIGAIAWNLLTWWAGLPSSSSHALIGGLVGAAMAQSWTKGVQWHGLAHKVAIPAVAAPAIAFGGAFLLLIAIYWLFVRITPGLANRVFRLGQLGSGTWVAFTHGA